MFSRRAGWDLAPNEPSERVRRRLAAGLPVLDLSESNPTMCALPDAGAHLRAALASVARDERTARYEPDARGEPETRAAVAAYHVARGCRTTPDEVVLTAGTSEGYAHLFRLLTDAGDRVLVPSPSYPLFGLLAGLESVEAAAYPLRRRGGRWRIDCDALAAAAVPPTRAILLVHPNNPTGSLSSADEVAFLRRLCRDRDLALVSDEVFADYRSAHVAPDAAPTLLPCGDEGEELPLTFVLSGASKVLGLPQLKVGWIVAAGPPGRRNEAIARLEVIADTYLSVSVPAQRALAALLASREACSGEIAGRVERNRAQLGHVATQCSAAEPLAAEAGWYAILRLSADASGRCWDEDAFVGSLLDGPGVVVQPGWLFDLEPRDEAGAPVAHVVVSLLPEPRVFDEGIAHVLAAAASQPR